MNEGIKQLSATHSNTEPTSEQVEIPNKRSLRSQSPLEIWGRLVHAGYGYPLMGLAIQAVFLDLSNTDAAAAAQNHPHETIIGTGNSGPGGDFQITFLDTPVVQQRICLLKICPQARLVLKVYVSAPRKKTKQKRSQAAPRLYYVTEPLDGAVRYPITLEISVPAKPVPPTRWKELSSQLERARLHTCIRSPGSS